jgi:hypothetical protein
MTFDLARKVADAVLYEGYILYPYRASSAKNNFRFQFGVLAPREYSEKGGGEPWFAQTECLIEPRGEPAVDIRVRFLQLVPRDGWDEGHEREFEVQRVTFSDAAESETTFPIEVPEGAVSAIVRVSAERVDSFLKMRVRVENSWTGHCGTERAEALHHSLAGTHTLLAVHDGAFVSLIDPPAEARRAATACANVNAWPVLVGRPGERAVMLSAPIILYDYPQIAPESQGDFFDSTEIDELLALRVMTMTDQEKQEARATDPRAATIIERTDSIPREMFEKLHGAIRELKTPNAVEDFFNPRDSAPPESAAIEIGGQRISKGARVRLRPQRRADSMDLFLAGRFARVEAVHRDVEDRTYVAVVVEDDPAADLHGRVGRFLYFHPDELEPVNDRGKG